MPLTLTRSLLAIILPGAMVCAPLFLLVSMRDQHVATFYEAYTFLAHVLAFGVVVLVGAVLEEFGSYLEKRWDGRVSAEPTDQGWVHENWISYLAREFASSEPVGYRYLSRKVTALYFELGLMFAGPLLLIGTASLGILEFGWRSGRAVTIAIALAVITSALFYKFARDTHFVLCSIRRDINERIDRNRAAQKLGQSTF
jgi:hypothetical protein